MAVKCAQLQFCKAIVSIILLQFSQICCVLEKQNVCVGAAYVLHQYYVKCMAAR